MSANRAYRRSAASAGDLAAGQNDAAVLQLGIVSSPAGKPHMRNKAAIQDDRPIISRGYYSLDEGSMDRVSASKRRHRGATNAASVGFNLPGTADDAAEVVSPAMGVYEFQAAASDPGELSAPPSVGYSTPGTGSRASSAAATVAGHGRRSSSTTIGKVSGLANERTSHSLRDLSPGPSRRRSMSMSRPPSVEMLVESVSQAEEMPQPAPPAKPPLQAPPELATKLLALVEQLVRYKDRLAHEQAARRLLEQRLAELHDAHVEPLAREVQLLQEADHGRQRDDAVLAGVAGMRTLGLGVWSDSDQLSSDQLALAAALLRTPATGGHDGLGGQAGLLGQLLAAEAIRQGNDAGHRASYRAPLSSALHEVVGSSSSSDMGAGVGHASAEDEEVQAVLDREEGRHKSTREVPRTMPFDVWRLMEAAKAHAGKEEDRKDAPSVATKPQAGAQTRREAIVTAVAAILQRCTDSAAVVAAKVRRPWRAVDRLSARDPSAGAGAAARLHAAALLVVLSIVVMPFSLHHWGYGNFASGQGAGASSSAPQFFLPSSYTTSEASVLAGQLVTMFGALVLGAAWVVTRVYHREHVTDTARMVSDQSRPSDSPITRLFTPAIVPPADTSKAKDEADVLPVAQAEPVAEVVTRALEKAASRAARDRPERRAELFLRRTAVFTVYIGLWLWLLYLCSQLMLGTSMWHRQLAGSGPRAAGLSARVAWVEALTPLGTAILLSLFHWAVGHLESLEQWHDLATGKALTTVRLWVAHVSVALLQVLGYILVADTSVMRAPMVQLGDAFPLALTDGQGLYQQLKARVVLARPLVLSSEAGGTSCRIDAAAAGLWRLMLAYFVVDRLACLMRPMCFEVALAVWQGVPHWSSTASGATEDSKQQEQDKAAAPAAASAPLQYDPAVTLATASAFFVVCLAAIIFSPLAVWPAAVLTLAAMWWDGRVVSWLYGKDTPEPSLRYRPARLFSVLLFITCVIMACVHAAVLSSRGIPTSCAVAGPVAQAALFSSSPLARGADPYCTAVQDVLPAYGRTHGWLVASVPSDQASSPWYWASTEDIPQPTTASVVDRRRLLYTAIVGEEVAWWMDNACQPQCLLAQASYRSNHTGLEPDVASDVYSDDAWCAKHCTDWASVIPACPLVPGQAVPNATFSYRWPTQFVPDDQSTWAQPFGQAATTSTVFLAPQVTRPCDLACGAWVGHASGLDALRSGFTSNPLGSMVWYAVHHPLVLWLSLVIAGASWAAAVDRDKVARALAAERYATLQHVTLSAQRSLHAMGARLNLYKSQAHAAKA